MASYSLLTCQLPDDDVAGDMETNLLLKWGFSEDFAKLSYLRPTNSTKSGNIQSDPATECPEMPTKVKNDIGIEPTDGVTQSKVGEKDADVTTCLEPSLGDSDTNGTAKEELHSSVKELYIEAEASFRSGQYCDSLIYIDDALETNVDSSGHVKLWTLRAKVMNAMEDFLETLKSVDNVKANMRPHELCIEGAKALQKLGLLYTAEQWLKQIIMDREREDNDDVSGDDDDDGVDGGRGSGQWSQRAIHLFQDIRNSRIYGPLVKDKPIKISVSRSGRSVHATRNIAKGELIFSELPELLEQSISSHNITACAQCGLSLVKPEDVFAKGQLGSSELQKVLKRVWTKRAATPCDSCDRVVYCSESCRKDAWDSYHKVICPSSTTSTAAMLYDVRTSFREVMAHDGSTWQGWWNAEFSPTLMARMWATIYSSAKELAGNDRNPTLDDWSKASARFEKYCTTDDSTTCDAIPKMYELMNNIFKRSKFLRQEISKTDFNKRYSQLLSNYVSFHDVSDPLRQFVDKVTKDRKLYKKIGKYFQEPLPKAEFHGFFPLACCLNHSCFPNAELVSANVRGQPGVVVLALKDITVLDEIVVSYVSQPGAARKERREQLLRRYKFWCGCPRCLYEGDGPELCSYCGKQALVSREGELFSTPAQQTPKIPLSSATEELRYEPQAGVSSESTCLQESSKITNTDGNFGKRERPVDKLSSSSNIDPDHIQNRNSSENTINQDESSPPNSSILVTPPENSNFSENGIETDLQVVTSSQSEINSPRTSEKPAEKKSEKETELGNASIGDLFVQNGQSAQNSFTNSEANSGSNDKVLNSEATAEEGEILQSKSAVSVVNNNIADKSSADTENGTQHNTASLLCPSHPTIGESEESSTTAASSVSENKSVTRKKFPHCGKCGRAWYCSPKCQKEAWKKGHKKICGKI